jgi:hypothetical protein
MCGHDHDHKHEEEIDIVDLLGVIIKRRKFIIWFVVCFTIFASLLVFFRGYKKSIVSLRSGFTASDILTTQNDTILASYIFLNKSDKQEGYQAFVNSLLFPAVVDAPTFEIQRGENFDVNYLFVSPDEAKRFLDRYNEFIDELVKLKTFQNGMSEDVNASCIQLYRGKTVDTGKGMSAFFSNSKDASNCNAYNYYYALIQGKLKYVTGRNVDDYYFPFVSSAVKDAKVSKLKPANDKEAKDVKIKVKRNFNVKKVAKYSILLFIFSIMVALVMAFVIEFWANNKKRISGYWR